MNQFMFILANNKIINYHVIKSFDVVGQPLAKYFSDRKATMCKLSNTLTTQLYVHKLRQCGIKSSA